MDELSMADIQEIVTYLRRESHGESVSSAEDHVRDVHEGCERFFLPGYNASVLLRMDAALPAVRGSYAG
jgi:hypothetical protein